MRGLRSLPLRAAPRWGTAPGPGSGPLGTGGQASLSALGWAPGSPHPHSMWPAVAFTWTVGPRAITACQPVKRIPNRPWNQTSSRTAGGALAASLLPSWPPWWAACGLRSHWSPQVALVQWTESVGLTLVNRDLTSMQLRTPSGQILTYYVLQMFPFTSESKRMGVIVRVRVFPGGVALRGGGVAAGVSLLAPHCPLQHSFTCFVLPTGFFKVKSKLIILRS